jgi:catalase
MPESMHAVMWIMSDRTLPRSLRMMEGFGVHSYRLVNARGESTFVKFHWRPKLGLQSTIWDEAMKIAGADPDFHRRDLFEAIGSGAFPEWEFAVQLFTQEQADKFPFDHLDPTKLISEELVPLQVIGRMVLNRWPDNFFAETEQVAYCPANIVPGIDFSNDPLLQGRLFSYLDTQLLRLGSPNFNQIPINAPKCPFANLQRDGKMQAMQPKGRVSYEPNSLAQDSPRESPTTGFRSADVNERETKAASAQKALPTTTARHGSSIAAKLDMSRRTSRPRSFSNFRRWSMFRCARPSSLICVISMRISPNASPMDLGSKDCPTLRRRPHPCRIWSLRRRYRSSGK